MKLVTAEEIQSLVDYDRERADLRRRMIAVKARRRVGVGANLTILFENHDTVLYQIQEMLHIEKISDPDAIAHEMRTYNELIAEGDELGATLLIEYEDPAERDERLRELLGLEQHVWLAVDGVGECRAEFDTRQVSAKRISSVHYLRFPLGGDLADAIRNGALPEIVVDHPSLSEQTLLTPDQAAALAEDLAG